MGREFTGESAFGDAYSEYFDVVYREALKPSRSRRNCAGCLLHGICTEWK